MRGDIRQIVYELDGQPVGLTSEAEWREAIRRGELGRETPVEVYREGEGRPHSLPAAEVPKLAPLFDALETPVRDRGGAAEGGAAAGGPEDGATAVGDSEARGRKAGSRRPSRRASGEKKVATLKGPYDPHAEIKEVAGKAEPSGRRRRLVLLGSLLLLALAGVAVAVGLSIRPEPFAVEVPQWYRVIASADIRKRPSADAEPVERLARNRILKGVPDETTRRRWLRIANGRHAGFYFKMEDLEIANVTGDEIEIVD